ncbi:hypothetical protein B0H16DRAFT_1744915 [Mycena metata]|uniref:Uncharacterized protein n=1 Tax=Mycena metata TaxID=1033252 RepID=A0AAD7MDI4_9AGAR|nr:hypothetical protein B0H16DRAFT_1744915 [Mycena metata]
MRDETFTDAQHIYLKTLEPDFKAYILAEAKGDKDAAEKAARKWKDDQVSAILAKIKAEFPYPTSWVKDTTDKKVVKYLRRYFGNLLHGNIVRSGLVQPGVAPSSSNALFTAPAPLTGRQLYAAQEKNEVLSYADTLKDDPDVSTNPAGRYQSALKVLWAEKDDKVKQEYEEEARQKALHVDIARNQEDFEARIGGTLQDLCTNGALGPAEMMLFVSYRNATGALSTVAVHSHCDENQRSFADFATDYDGFRAQWDAFSAEVLPRPAAQDHEGWSAIPRSATGIPLFPTVDFDNTTRAGLAQIADLFLKVSWDHTWPSDKVYTTLPYDQLTKHPDDFYDTQQYTFRLNIPLAEMSLSQLSRIIEDLITISTTDSPFVFREKRDILARRQSRTCSPSLPPAPVPIVPPPPPPSTETQTLPLVPPASKAAPATNPTLPPPPPPSTETQTPAPATSTAAPPSAEDLTPPPPPPSTETQTAPPVPPASTAAPAAVEDPTFPLPPPPSTNAVKKPVRGKGQKRTAAVAFGADADPGADSEPSAVRRGGRPRKSPEEAREERAQVAAAAHARTAAKVKTTKQRR